VTATQHQRRISIALAVVLCAGSAFGQATAPRTPSTVVAIEPSDPTELTTRQLQREIALAKESMNARLEAMDKAIVLLQAFADRSPTTATVAQSVKSLEALSNEKFASVQKQFEGASTALAAALQAAKEAVGKTEMSVAKTIDQQQQSKQQTDKAFDDKINDLKDRVTAMEGRSEGYGNSWGIFLGAFGAIGVILMAITLVLANRRAVVKE
jgi:hypothetical protein